MKKIIFVVLLFFVSCRKSDDSVFWYYDVRLRSDNVVATYRTQDGTYKTDRIFDGWIYGWGTRTSTPKYDISLVNKSQFGGDMMVRVIKVYYDDRGRDTIDIVAGYDSIRLKRL